MEALATFWYSITGWFQDWDVIKTFWAWLMETIPFLDVLNVR